MAITLVGAAGLLGSIALIEGLAALLEHIEGDPEADVQVALRQLAARNQRRAFSLAAVEQAGKEDVEQQFARFNEIPSRVLSEVSLSRQGDPRTNPDTGLLDFVSARLGVPSRELSRVSAPARMGDMSQVHRRLESSLSTPPPTPGQ
ncbi:hypothetical protein LCGC14_0455400 [marine sediment metagenome]|uniref:Uncharacterized protein n=1 Tax=marine sediment metagenome TaxID=412755 RepID=A0A0F9V3I6_9ZZZZ